jgi:hypothetical protein
LLQVQMNYFLGEGALARCAARGAALMHKILSSPFFPFAEMLTRYTQA